MELYKCWQAGLAGLQSCFLRLSAAERLEQKEDASVKCFYKTAPSGLYLSYIF